MTDLTPARTCALLGVSANSLRALADAGDLPSGRTAGSHRRFAEADVVATFALEVERPPPP